MHAPNGSLATGQDTRQVALLSALAVSALALVIVPLFTFGPLSTHMAVHIGTMNIAAPLAAVALCNRWRRGSAGLWIATLAQLTWLWVAHSPVLHHAAHGTLPASATMHVLLFLAALAFWIAVVSPATSRLHAVLALLLTGKLSCLLGALLIFAPRLLYAPANALHAHLPPADTTSLLADQHLAGLLMIAACPLSYVLAAVVITAQTIIGMDATTEGETRTPARRIAA